MAFCNSCGATLDSGTKFCNKCGAAVPAPSVAVPVAATSAAPAAKSGGSSALKIILIVVAVIVGLVLIVGASCSYIAYRAVKGTHVRENNGNVKVETPFGKIETNTNPEEAARKIGLPPYPGSTAVKNGTATMDMGGMHTSSAEFETSDAPATVADFYKGQLSKPQVMSNGEIYTLVSGDSSGKDVTTVTIEASDGTTRIHMSHVTRDTGN